VPAIDRILRSLSTGTSADTPAATQPVVAAQTPTVIAPEPVALATTVAPSGGGEYEGEGGGGADD
jgi:hypothetical protein